MVIIALDKQNKVFYFKNFLFIFGMCIWQTYNVLFLTNFPTMHTVELNFIRTFSLIILVASSLFGINLKKFNIMHFLFACIILFFLFNNWYIAQQSSWFDLLIIIVAGVNIDFDYFLKRFLIFSIFIYGGITILAILNVIHDNVVIIGLARSRHTLGFSWPSFLAHEIVTITASMIWLYKEKLNYLVIVLLFVVNYFVYVKTDTKLPYIVVTFALFMTLVLKKIKFGKLIEGFIYKIIPLLPLGFTLLIYYLSVNAQNYPKLDNLFSQRLTLGNSALIEYPIKEFGQPIIVTMQKTIVQKYFTIDSSYLRYLLCFGLISTILILIIMFCSFRKILKKQNLFIALVLFIILIDGFSDPWLFNAGYTPFIILLSNTFFNNTEDVSSKLE
ncbi:hypothetical protein REH36_00210 [Pediococcus pentosaceus]|uniref:hypothetical protein n=1 Tax=Pediococcus pentosaceus TaxID=1255 RepID=UPI002B4BE469|nr:hypothetical protein [Pediococcus pentosaceus]MEB3376390.1 hypothetical protein [Pediococcus pentosaceus]